mgnify:CR=1 FL=1
MLRVKGNTVPMERMLRDSEFMLSGGIIKMSFDTPIGKVNASIKPNTALECHIEDKHLAQGSRDLNTFVDFLIDLGKDDEPYNGHFPPIVGDMCRGEAMLVNDCLAMRFETRFGLVWASIEKMHAVTLDAIKKAIIGDLATDEGGMQQVIAALNKYPEDPTLDEAIAIANADPTACDICGCSYCCCLENAS